MTDNDRNQIEAFIARANDHLKNSVGIGTASGSSADEDAIGPWKDKLRQQFVPEFLRTFVLDHDDFVKAMDGHVVSNMSLRKYARQMVQEQFRDYLIASGVTPDYVKSITAAYHLDPLSGMK